MTTRHSRSAWHVWKAPLLHAALTLAGLVTALVGSDAWHALAWGILTVPVLACCHYGLRRNKG